MKKPTLIIISLIVLAIIVTISFAVFGKKKEPERIVKNHGPYQSKGFEVLENDTIIGWLLRQKTVECKVETPNGTVSMKVKDGKIRVDGLPYAFAETAGAPAGLTGVDLTDGNAVYRWDSATKKGEKVLGLNLDPNATATEEQKTAGQKSWIDQANEFETAGDKYTCAEASLPDSDFEVPKDIVFAGSAQ